MKKANKIMAVVLEILICVVIIMLCATPFFKDKGNINEDIKNIMSNEEDDIDPTKELSSNIAFIKLPSFAVDKIKKYKFT